MICWKSSFHSMIQNPLQLQISSCSVAIRQEMACCTKLNFPNIQMSSTMRKTRRARSWEDTSMPKTWFLTPRYLLSQAKRASVDRESPGSKRSAGGSEVEGLRLLGPGSGGVDPGAAQDRWEYPSNSAEAGGSRVRRGTLINSVVERKIPCGGSGWPSQLSICLWLWSWSWGPGVESQVGLPAQLGVCSSRSLYLSPCSLTLSLSHSLSVSNT